MKFIHIEKETQDKPTVMDMFHSHEYYELYFLVKGEKSVFIKSKFYKITEHQIVITKPYELHKFEGGPFERILLCISEEYLCPGYIKFLNLLSDIVSINIEDKYWNLILKNLSQIQKIYDSLNKIDNHEMQLTILLGQLFYIMNHVSSSITPTVIIDKTKTPNPITLKIVNYIETHLDEKITLEKLSSMFCISKSWINKNFNKDMNSSVINYQLKFKINKAKKMVCTSSVPINKIAVKLGFSSSNYFTIMFKRYVGVSPEQYRKNWIIKI